MKRSNLPPIALIDTKNVPYNVWADGLRQHGPAYKDPMSPLYIPICVGGSEVSIITGDNPWKCLAEFHAEKTGAAKPKYERKMPQDLLDAGHILEDFVAKRFRPYMERVCGIPASAITVENDTIMYQHPDYKFAVVNLDRRITVNGIPGILECKTTGNWGDIAKWKAGIVPKKYEWQCRYYMAVMNLNYCYIACAWGYGEDDYAVIKIERDLEIEEVMMDMVADFVQCCEDGIEPSMNQQNLKALAEYYKRLYGVTKEEVPIDLPDNDETREAMDIAMELKERKEEIEKLQKAYDEMEAKVTSTLLKYAEGKGTYISLRLDDETVCSVKIQPSYHKDTFDEERFKADHPAEYAEFLKEEVVKKLDMTGLKKKYSKGQLDLPSYKIPGELNVDKPVVLKKVELRKIPVAVPSDDGSEAANS